MKKVLLTVMMIVGVLHSVQAQNGCSTCGDKPKEKKKTEQPKNNAQADPPKKGKDCNKEPNKAKEPCAACEIASVHTSSMEAPYDGFIKVFWFTKGPCTKTPIVTGLPAGVGFNILYDDNNRPYINVGPFKGVGCTMKIVFNDINTGDPVTRELPIVAQPKPVTIDSSAYQVSMEDDRSWIQRNGCWVWPLVGVVVVSTGAAIVHNNPDIFCHLFDKKGNNPPPDPKPDPGLNNSTGQVGVNGHDPGGP